MEENLSGNTLQYVMEELNSTTDQAIRNAAKATQKIVKPKPNVEELGITHAHFTEARVAYENSIDTTMKSERGIEEENNG